MSKTTTNGLTVFKKVPLEYTLGFPKPKFIFQMGDKYKCILFAHVLIIAIVERNVKTKFK